MHGSVNANYNTNTFEKPLLLFLDDESDNLDAMERLFRKKFTVLKALTAAEAFSLLEQHPQISILISDQRMPEMTGVEFLKKSIETHPESIRILLTGYTDIDSVIKAINQGQIYRYLTKPWDAIDLQNTVDTALEKYLLKEQLNIKNLELKKALNNLQVLDQAKSQFMILINHELKTPLTSILSFIDLLKETILSEEQNLFVQRISKSSDKLKNIIDDVLVIVKGELGTIPIQKENFKIDSIFFELPNEISLSLKNKNQMLRFNINQNEIKSDVKLIKIILMRALHNATKFGLSQSDIQINSDKTSDNKIIISIHNLGPRIADEKLDQLVKPFYIDEHMMNHSVGMGLGLTICQTLTKCLNGNFRIKNNENGVFTEFIF